MTKLLNHKSFLYLVAILALLILFDAAQQKYYVDTFELTQNTIPLAQFIGNHLARWLVWLLFSFPIILVSYRLFSENIEKKTVLTAKIMLVSFITLLLSIVTISFISILDEGSSMSVFHDRFVFFFFQKGITFLLADVAIVLYIKMIIQSKTIEAQWVEIESLKTHESLDDSERKILVKQGDYTKPLPFKEISWIQADDYCVRIHTIDKSYYLRKSMKFLEEELKPFGFIRVHRGALLNLKFIDSLNYENSIVKLLNQEEVKISKSGQQALKQVLDKIAV